MKIGYLRVSTKAQKYERQLFALKECGVEMLFEEKISGTEKSLGREQFEKMLNTINKGDTVYFESMSRMARSIQDLIDTTNYMVKEKGVIVVFLKENLTIGGGNGLDAMGALIFNIMGAFAQFERDIISDRTKQALQAKIANGERLGRPCSISKEQESEIISLRKKGMKVKDIIVKYNSNKPTINRILTNAGLVNKRA